MPVKKQYESRKNVFNYFYKINGKLFTSAKEVASYSGVCKEVAIRHINRGFLQDGTIVRRITIEKTNP